MLKPYKTFYCTNSLSPTAFHLGDLINIYQQCAQMGNVTLFSKTICPCCKNSAEKVFKFLIQLNPAVKFGKLYTPITEMKPWWFEGKDKIDYVKAVKLPQKDSYISVQIDSRSQGKKIPHWAKKAIHSLEKVINIGDRPLKCKNKTKVNLQNKFDIIASSRYYVGIDSGLTHLALMTNTPIILIHPQGWDARKFYPDTKQITYVTTYSDFLEAKKYYS